MMESKQELDRKRTECEGLGMSQASNENGPPPTSNSEGEGSVLQNNAAKETASEHSPLCAIPCSSPCIPATRKTDCTEMPSQGQVGDNLCIASKEESVDTQLQSSAHEDVDSYNASPVKETSTVSSQSEIPATGKADQCSSQLSVTGAHLTSTTASVRENVDLPISLELVVSAPQTSISEMSNTSISCNSVTGSASSTVSGTSFGEEATSSVSCDGKVGEKTSTSSCLSSAGKMDISSSHSNTGSVTDICLDSSISTKQSSSSSTSEPCNTAGNGSISLETQRFITDKPLPSSSSGEVTVHTSDAAAAAAAAAGQMEMTPSHNDQTGLDHCDKSSPMQDGVDNSASHLSVSGEVTDTNLSDSSNGKLTSPPSFIGSKCEVDSEDGAVKTKQAGELSSSSICTEVGPSDINDGTNKVLDGSMTSLDNASNSVAVEQSTEQSTHDSTLKKNTRDDTRRENIPDLFSLTPSVSETADGVHSRAFEESHKEAPGNGMSASEAGRPNAVISDVLADAAKQPASENASAAAGKETVDKVTDASTGTSSQSAESQNVVEATEEPNDLTRNSQKSAQDSSQTHVNSCQDADPAQNATVPSEEVTEQQPSQSSDNQQLNVACESHVRSEATPPPEPEKSVRSLKEFPAADSESNSWDNSLTSHAQSQGGSHGALLGSIQQAGGSVPGSFADTESSNLSFASSSTSTTQPLDMGDIIKAGMDTDPVLLPEATSNVEDGSAAQLAVDEWCFKQAGASKQQTEESSAAEAGAFHPGNVSMEDEDSEFDWEEYMEDTNSSPAPDAAFPHVEASLRSNFEKGMKFEVAHSTENKYWIATVVMPCGQLLRLRYDGSESDSSKDFWCDAFTSDIHPLGWCRQNDKVLEPPDDLKEKFPDWHNYVQMTLAQATTASDKLLGGVLGTAAVDQIKQDMLVEVQDESDMTHVWIARVLENIGGRLLLRYEGTDSARQDFWLFYLHFRIHPMGWAQEMEMSYGPPEAVAEEWSRDEGWKAVLERAQSDAQTLPFPADVLADQEMVLDHAFKQGWKLEALHPVTKNRICPATVVRVYSDTYFLVQIDDHEPSLDDSPVQICCHGGSRNIFPINWAEKQGLKLERPHGWLKEFDWQNYLEEMKAEPAPPEVFNLECDDVKLSSGMKLEAANPEQPGQICVATVKQVCKPLVLIHLESSAELTSYHMVDFQSQEIFPVGWCESNSYPLQPPNKAFFKHKQKKKAVDEPPPKTQKSSSSSHSKSHGDKGGIWCPKIYFNHRCFSGPYLSKGRIAELPKSVGPGPVTLVMKEVLSMLINVAYKSSRVLRELQMDGDPDPSLHQQVLKAKYKGKSYRAVVELCKTSDQVVDFCKNICVKLECCPYLFSPTFINGQCPENCSQQSKTKYTAYVGKKKKKVGRPPGGHSNLEGGPKKPGKRRKRKRIGFFKVKKTMSNPESSIKDEEGDELDSVLNEESSNSTTASLDLVSSNGIHRRKRKYTRHVAPPLEMKTRGVKLPRYSIERRTRQPRLQMDSSIKAAMIDTAGPFNELQLQQAGRKSAFVVSPVKKESSLVLDTNPLLWSVGEVVEYIKTTDCAPLARLFKEEEIDGQALLLLTLPTVQELMEVKLGPAIKLCHLVEKLKIAFYEQYAV